MMYACVYMFICFLRQAGDFLSLCGYRGLYQTLVIWLTLPSPLSYQCRIAAEGREGTRLK